MSTYGDKAEALFRDGCNCSQAVVLAFDDVTHLDEAFASRLASPFGAGMGQLREVCGGFTGALMVLGIVDGAPDPTDRAARRTLYEKVRQLAAEFKAANGSIVCGELLGLRPPADPSEKLPRKQPCPVTVRNAADLLAQMLGLS